MTREVSVAARRRVPSQCSGCGQFVGPASSAWANGYHPECDPSRPEYDRTVRGAR